MPPFTVPPPIIDKPVTAGLRKPLAPVSADRDTDAVTPVAGTAPFLDTLKATLTAVANQAMDPIRRSTALAYLGYLDVHDHRRQLLMETDRLTRPVDALPHLDTLVNGYADRSRLQLLHRITDDAGTDTFHALWAHELLTHAGDRSRLAKLRALVRSPRARTADRLKGLALLTDMRDHSMQKEARAIGADPRLFQATQLQGLAFLSRMEWLASPLTPRGRRTGRSASKSTRRVRAAFDTRTLSLSERLTLAHQLSSSRDESVVPFLYRVIETDRETVVDQIRALNTLALLGHRTHIRTLRNAARLRPRARQAATRVLALMGDRSQTAAMVEACRNGNLDAARTLVLTRVLDQLRIPAAELRTRLRYRMLIDS